MGCDLFLPETENRSVRMRMPVDIHSQSTTRVALRLGRIARGPSSGPGLPGLTPQNYNHWEALAFWGGQRGTHKSVIVACPSCGARFNLDPAKLLPAGRNVRCAKCDHRWRQMPEGFDEPPAVEVAPLAPEPAPPASAESFAPPPPDEAESHPPSPPETPAEMAQSLAAIAEQVTGSRGDGYTVSEAPQAAPHNPISRLARRTGPTTGPITVPPRMRPMRPAKRSSHLGLVLMAGLLIGLLLAAYVFRDVIARTVPGADVIYSLFGLSTDNPAADLEISIDHTGVRKDAKTGQPVFEVQATVFNLSDYPVNMPVLMMIPVDDAGSQLEPIRFRLPERVVAPGQNIKFQKSFENWPPTAPNFVLVVADSQ